MPALTPPQEPSDLPLTAADVEEFRVIMQEECGVSLNEQEAWKRATELVNFARMLLGPLPEDPEAGSSKIV